MNSNDLVQDDVWIRKKYKRKAVCRKKWIAWCRLYLLGMVILLCFIEAVRHAENLKSQLFVLSFTASGQQDGMDQAAARLAQEQNLLLEAPLEFVNWTQKNGIQAAAGGLETVEECAALILCGRSDLLFPGYAVLDMEVRESCLISSTLSEKLFGGADTCGLTVEVQGRTLEVLDVIDSEEAFLAYEIAENDTCLLDRASVRCVPGSFGKTAESYGQLCGGWERMENRVLIWITQGMYGLVPCILWIFLICYCRCMLRNVGETDGGCAGRTERLLWKICLYLLLAGGVLLLIRSIRIPEDMIPAKWSNFEFWAEYGKRLGASCSALIRSEKKIPDIPIWKEFFRAILWGAGAVIGETVTVHGLTGRGL